MRRSTRGFFLSPLIAATALLTCRSVEARPRYAILAAVDPDRRSVEGQVAMEFENTSSAPLDAIELWNFPARLARRSPAIMDHHFYWIYPRSFSAGGMEVDDIHVEGRAITADALDVEPAGKGTILRIPLSTALAPGGRVRIDARFRTRIPERYGAFGCADGGCRLAGGFYPMLVQLDPDGWNRSAPPGRADIEVSVTAPNEFSILVDGTVAPSGRPVSLSDSAYPLVIVDRPFRRRTITARGVAFDLFDLFDRSAAPPDAPPGKALPYLVEDRGALVLHAAEEAIALLEEIGLDVPIGRRISIIEAPLRLDLAEPHPGSVLISDQLFRIFPVARFRKFHEFQFVRALFAALLEQRLSAADHAEDLAWSPDVGASWLVDRYTVRSYRRAEFAQDVLRWFSFVPAIDRILYAPQIPFAAAYFKTLDDAEPTRDDLRRFSNLHPRGKVLYEKLRDRLGDERIDRFGRDLWSGTPIRTAAERIAGEPLHAFWRQWLGPYPEVDYRFRIVDSARRGDGWVHRIVLYKRGPNPPIEPVELRVTERGGIEHQLRWDGEGSEHEFTVETARPIRTIAIDPRGRLVQRIAGENEDLRFNDRSPPRLKFLYNNFGALVNFQTLRLDLSLDFSLGRVLDLKNGFRFVLFRTAIAQIGAGTSYTRSFGRKITEARLSSGASVGLTAVRLEPNFGGAVEPLPGTRLIVSTGVGYGDRRYAWEPIRATGASLSTSYALTLHDSGRALHQATVGGGVERLQPLADGHGIAAQLSLAATFGNLHHASQMLSGGAPSSLRGYEPNELLGRARAILRAEYRHVFLHDLNANILHLLYLRGLTGGLFAEAGAISPCESYSFGRSDLFADIGYSLRLPQDWLGVSQAVLQIDVAVPLVRRARGCFQPPGVAPQDPSSRVPVSVFLYYGPVW